mgnify:CR=1 FL=1
MQGSVGYGHEPFLVALAYDAQKLLAFEHVVKLKVDEFGHAQSAREEHFDDGPVALALPFGEVDGSLHAVDFFGRKHLGQVFAYAGCFEQFGRVVPQYAVDDEILEERPHSTKYSCLRRRSDAELVYYGSEVLKMFEFHVLHLQVFVAQIVEQIVDVVRVCLHRIVGVASFEPEIAHVSASEHAKFVVLHCCYYFLSSKPRRIPS